MEKVQILIVDKLGTLTEGKPHLETVIAVDSRGETELLRLAASVEQASEHPLAGAIVGEAKERDITLSPVEEFRSITGKGVVAKVEGLPRSGR